MVPALGRSRPAIRFSRVVLPEPDGPISARNSPSGTSRFSSWSTSICSLPRRKYLCTPWTRTIGGPCMPAPAKDRFLPSFFAPRPALLLLPRRGLRRFGLGPEERDQGGALGPEVLALVLPRD